MRPVALPLPLMASAPCTVSVPSNLPAISALSTSAVPLNSPPLSTDRDLAANSASTRPSTTRFWQDSIWPLTLIAWPTSRVPLGTASRRS